MEMPEGFVYGPWANLNLKLFASIDPHHDAVFTEVILGIQVSGVTYY